MEENKNALLEKFKSKQSEKSTLASQEALRLVNLYRSLSYFNPEFVDKYNQMLLSTPSSVQRLLHTFMGGEEVEDYLEFLQQNVHLSDIKEEEQNSSESQIKGYLPQPDSDIQMPNDKGDKVSVSKIEWEQLKQNQKTLQEQLHSLLEEMKNIKQKVAYDPKKSANKALSEEESYSEIVEENSEDKSYE